MASDTGHQESNCDCNNEYIIVTNSRKPRPTSARAARAFRQSQYAWQRSTPFHSTSMIDLSDVHDSIRGKESDYEICSVSSDEDNITRRETVADTGPQFQRPFSRVSESRSTSTSRMSRQTCASSRSRVSSRLQSRENTWNSHSAHNILTDTPSISRNRNSADQKPDFRKDLNTFL